MFYSTFPLLFVSLLKQSFQTDAKDSKSGFMAARANASSLFLITSIAIMDVVIAIFSVVVGNALTHRKNKLFARWVGRVVQTPGFLSTSRSIIGQYKMI